MDPQFAKLLSRAKYNSSHILKLLLLPAIFILFEVIFLQDQPLINPFIIISSYSYLNSSLISTSRSSVPAAVATASATAGSSTASSNNTYFNSSSHSSLKSSTDAATSRTDSDGSSYSSYNPSRIDDSSAAVPSACNIFKGEWVPHPAAPYYTNTTCPMIQLHQNCMKYGRPDMEFLKWRWKPQECELPLFDPVRFLELVRGKSMAFVGDSLARNHMQSLLCLLTRVEHPKDISETKDDRFKSWYYANYNFTILIFWSPFLVKAQEMEKDGLWHVYLDEIDTNWASRIEAYDYLIISDSNWFTRPSMYFINSQLDGCIYCGAENVTYRSFYYVNKLAFQTVFQAIDNFKGLTILRTVSPSHFENGPWNDGGNCNRTRPFRENETTFHENEHEMYKAQLEVFEEAKTKARKRGRDMKLMDMTDAMLLRPDGHPDRYGHWPHEYANFHKDCVHWCLPGPVDLWNELLLHMLSGSITSSSSSSYSNSSSHSSFDAASPDAPTTAANATTSQSDLNASSYSSFNLSRDDSRPAIASTCNIFRGEWVPDLEGPYYTNLTCSMIQPHQNCLKYGRPDKDYLMWRWKPDECELQRFDPARFLELVRGKSMAFVGDSLARNHMQSLLCLLTRVEHPKDVSETKDDRFKRWYYANYNFTILIFWSPFLVKAQEMEKDGLWHVYLDEIDTNWASRIEAVDYLIISDSNWFTRPSMYFINSQLDGCIYCGAKNVTYRSFYYVNKLAFQTVFQAIDKVSSFKGRTILRTVSPSHFENGPWNNGGNCNRTKPILRNETTFHENEHEMYKAQLEVFEEAKTEARKRGREIKLMDMTDPMLLRPDGHPDRYGHWPHEYMNYHKDCVHWCLPGPVDLWNEFLLHMLST